MSLSDRVGFKAQNMYLFCQIYCYIVYIVIYKVPFHDGLKKKEINNQMENLIIHDRWLRRVVLRYSSEIQSFSSFTISKILTLQ